MPESKRASDRTGDTDQELLFETKGPGFHLRLWLQNDQMECYGDLEMITRPSDSCAVDAAETAEQGAEHKASDGEAGPVVSRSREILTPAALIDIFQQHGITRSIDFENLYRFCTAAAEEQNVQKMLLARGISPQKGRDGWFEMCVKTTGDQPEFQEDEKGNIDLRTLHRFSEIEPGQKLGTVHPSQDGVPGMTVTGLPIPAERGKPFPLVAGEGVVLKYDGRVAFAERAGRALLNKQQLAVVDELVVPGDLDLQTGNVDFHGFVEIKGDVPDDFIVKASKGMRITGTVGASSLEAGGPLEIGSMAGKGVGQIICHGDLQAGYLNQATVACYGNVLVNNEIRNSQVKATGRMVVERGAIIGGKSVALEGIEAKVLGTVSGLRTQLVAGIYFPDADRFDYLHERFKHINRQLQSIREALGPLERIQELGTILDKASTLRLSILNQQWEKLEQEKEQVNAELAASKQQVFSCSNPKINVLKTIKEGVIVVLGQASEEFKLEISGPLTLIENTSQGGVRHLSYSPLSTLAATLETQILKQEKPADKSIPEPEG